MKIAVMVPHRPHFGNIITQLPLFCALKERYPQAEITIFSKVNNHQLLLDTGAADKLIVYKKLSIWALIKKLRTENFDQIYNIYAGSEKVHLATALSKAKLKAGFSDRKWLSIFYNRYLTLTKGQQYIAYNNLALVNQVEQCHYKPDIVKKLADINGKQTSDSNILTIVPCGGAGDYKRWDINHYCSTALQVIDACKIDKVRFILGPSEQDLVATIDKALPEELIEIIQSPSVQQLIQLAIESNLTIGNDCGPMHVFQMLDNPLIMLWGWNHRNHSPFGTMREWFHAKDSAWAITPSEQQKAINTIPPEKVSLLANAILNNSIS